MTSVVTDRVTKQKKRRRGQVKEIKADDTTSLLDCEEGMCNDRVQVNRSHRNMGKLSNTLSIKPSKPCPGDMGGSEILPRLEVGGGRGMGELEGKRWWKIEVETM